MSLPVLELNINGSISLSPLVSISRISCPDLVITGPKHLAFIVVDIPEPGVLTLHLYSRNK